MKNDPAIREAITAFLETHPSSRMGDVVAHVLAKGLSTEGGIHSVTRNLVEAGAVDVDRSNPNFYRYSLKDDTRTVHHVDAERFQVPAELAGPIVPPMIWSMRHLLGVSA